MRQHFSHLIIWLAASSISLVAEEELDARLIAASNSVAKIAVFGLDSKTIHVATKGYTVIALSSPRSKKIGLSLMISEPSPLEIPLPGNPLASRILPREHYEIVTLNGRNEYCIIEVEFAEKFVSEKRDFVVQASSKGDSLRRYGISAYSFEVEVNWEQLREKE